MINIQKTKKIIIKKLAPLTQGWISCSKSYSVKLSCFLEPRLTWLKVWLEHPVRYNIWIVEYYITLLALLLLLFDYFEENNLAYFRLYLYLFGKMGQYKQGR